MAGTPLVIEYVVEGRGHQRGYNFTSATQGYSDDVLKAIWRAAMPRGQGWGGDGYVGARSLKCFPLPDGRMALSQITVTDQTDESGRRGIRRAEIEVLRKGDVAAKLHALLLAIPPNTRGDADYQLAHWRRLRSLDLQKRKLKKTQQLVLAHSFSTTADWQVVEAVILKLALDPPGALRAGLPHPLAFTTLALDFAGEQTLVGVPLERARGHAEIAVLVIA